MPAPRLRRAEEALSRSAGGAVYLAAADREAYDRLTGSAAAAWTLLADGPTFGALLSDLASLHDVPAQKIEPEVRSLMDDLVRRGWVRVSA
jgi:hypothetical protein